MPKKKIDGILLAFDNLYRGIKEIEMPKHKGVTGHKGGKKPPRK